MVTMISQYARVTLTRNPSGAVTSKSSSSGEGKSVICSIAVTFNTNEKAQWFVDWKRVNYRVNRLN